MAMDGDLEEGEMEPQPGRGPGGDHPARQHDDRRHEERRQHDWDDRRYLERPRETTRGRHGDYPEFDEARGYDRRYDDPHRYERPRYADRMPPPLHEARERYLSLIHI